MKRRVLYLSSIIVLGIPGVASAVPPVPAPAPATSASSGRSSRDGELRAFAGSRFTYCDAKHLSGLWQQSVYESKARIGRKVLWHDERTVDGMLVEVRRQTPKNPATHCTYDEAGYSFADVETLAKAWKLSTWETKARIEQKVADGLGSNVRGLLVASGGTPVAGSDAAAAAATQKERNAFQSSGLNYCDAAVLAGHWKTSVDEAKLTVGRKIGWDNRAFVDAELQKARKATETDATKRCAFGDTGVSLAEAQKLAALWKKPLPEAKATIAAKISAGKSPDAQTRLARPLKAFPNRRGGGL